VTVSRWTVTGWTGAVKVSTIGNVGSVVDETLPIGLSETPLFFGGEKPLLDLSGESMEALRVRLGDQVGQLKRSGLA
jgi:hypothetical protein